MMIQFETQCADCLFTDYIPLPFSLPRLKHAFSSWQKKLRGKAWNMLYLENHDHPRIISRYGSERFWKESGKTLAAAYLFLQGTPFVYQGQEIGMINWKPDSIDQYRDVQTIWNYHHSALNKTEEERLKRLWRSSRDNARTPVQWSSEKNAGFTTGTPWFYVNPNYKQINAADQEKDPNSLLNFYKEAIRLRKSLKVVRHGSYREHFHGSSKLYVYSRQLPEQKLLVICSFTREQIRFELPEEEFDLMKATAVLTNYEQNFIIANGFTTRPYELRVYMYEDEP